MMTFLANSISKLGHDAWTESRFDRDRLQFFLYPSIALLAIMVLTQSLYRIIFHPISKVPGPFLAKLTNLYMLPSQMRLHRAQTLRDLHDVYGPVVRIGPNEVSVSDWRVYREIYSLKASTKSYNFYAATRLAGHDSMFTLHNKEEASSRRKLQNHAYSQQAVLANEALIADKAAVMVQRLTNLAEETKTGKTVNAYHLAGLFSLEVILACAFNRHQSADPAGESLTLLKAMDASAVAIILAAVTPFLNRATGRRLPGSAGKAFQQWDLWQSLTEDFLNGFTNDTLNTDTTEKFMITPVFANPDASLGRKLTLPEVVEESMAIMFAGSGTTSTTLTYLIYSLSRDPARQQRLREELSTADENLTELRPLLFLSAVIKETFRVYPAIISTLPRFLDIPVVVGDHILPPGTQVGMQNYVHHRDRELFKSPDEWIPERWLDDNGGLRDMEAALTPFSIGPRSCAGQNLARAELYLAASKIFRRLRLTLNSAMTERDMEVEDRFNIAPVGRRLLIDVEIL